MQDEDGNTALLIASSKGYDYIAESISSPESLLQNLFSSIIEYSPQSTVLPAQWYRTVIILPVPLPLLVKIYLLILILLREMLSLYRKLLV